MSEDYDALSHALQIQVDEAFDKALNLESSIELPCMDPKKPTVVAHLGSAGGFILESDGSPSKSIPYEVIHDHPSENDLIPVSLIPSALQRLDLPADDEDVLQVFRNAAGGWSRSPRTDGLGIVGAREEKQGGAVSRKDWRAVCAVIIGDRKSEVTGGFLNGDEQAAFSPGQDSLLGEQPIESEGCDDENNEDEAYQASSLTSLSSGHGSDTDSDEYVVEPSSSKSQYKSSGRKSERTSASISHGTPTSRQTRASLEAFALFFSSSPLLSDADLTTKRIMFKDVVRVADMLKEKINADEVRSQPSARLIFSVTFNIYDLAFFGRLKKCFLSSLPLPTSLLLSMILHAL